MLPASAAWTSGSQQNMILSPKRHLEVSGDVFACHTESGGVHGFQWLEARDAANI